MFAYNEKRAVDLEEAKAKDVIQRGQQAEIARQALQTEAQRANGPVRARSRWARATAVILILAVVAAVLAQIFFNVIK